MSNVSEQIKAYFQEQDKHATVNVAMGHDRKNCSVSLSVIGRGMGGLASFKNLVWLSKILGTDDIDIRDEYQHDGCETCDYGASTSATIYCKNIKE